MAATTIRELLTKLGVQADTLAVQRFDAALNIAKRTMLLTAGAAVVLTGAILGATVATARQGDEAAKAGKRIGITAEEMQELGFAAQQTGATINDVERALKQQARGAVEAADGTAEYADSFRALGITDPSDLLQGQIGLFEQLADGFKELPTDIERTARAQEIFGRAGTKLVPLLKQGSEGIRRMREEAQQLGFVLSEEDAQAAEKFTDAMNRARLVVVAIRNQIGKALIPTLTSMLNGFRDFVLTNRQIIRVRIDRFMLRIRQAVDVARAAFQRINMVIVDELGGWDAIFQQIDKAAKLSGAITGLTAFVALVKAANLALLGFAANPVALAVGAAVIAVVLLGLAIDDLIVFANGGNSAIGKFLEAMDPALAEEFRQSLVDLRMEFGALGGEIIDILNEIETPLGDLGDLIKTLLGEVVIAEFKRMNAQIQGFIGLLKSIPTVLRGIVRISPILNLGAPGGETEQGGAPNRGRSLFDALGGGGLAGLGQQALGTPAAAAAGGGGATTVVFQGDTNSFTGSDLSRAELEQFFNERQATKNRQAIAASRGGDR